ncbi:MAG: hypothetical protein FJ276_33740, partial [Planctomycetes bacterium]|nr:hypothetical protein [Planctomycetota bacterium]
MLKAIVISLFAVMAIVAWWRPRAGLAFLWFAIWLYPVKGMYGLLPLDIRLSDVWVLYMAVIALAMTGLAAWRNRAVRLAALWFLAILAGDVSGWFLGESVSPTPFLKDALKALYVPCTAFTFAAFVHDGRDLRRQMTWLAAAAAAAGILGILMVHFPLDLDAFLIPKEKLAWQPEVIANAELVYRRAKGALGTPGLAQIVMTGLLVAL